MRLSKRNEGWRNLWPVRNNYLISFPATHLSTIMITFIIAGASAIDSDKILYKIMLAVGIMSTVRRGVDSTECKLHPISKAV
jgi:hypothetical protein